jgi:type I restriction enzyme S subunit
MSEWKNLTLKQAGIALIDCDHTTPISTNSGYPYVTIPQLKDGRIDLSDVRFISKEDFELWTRKAKPQTHDVIVSRRCNPGESAYVADGMQFALGQNLVLLRSDNKTVLRPFLRWLVKSPAWWGEVKKFLNVGAIFNSLKCKEITGFTLPIPPIDEQKRIIDIIYCLDAKIENLRRQNETLEQIAQTLFKHWFIDFEFPNADGKPYKSSGGAMSPSELGDIPEGWRVGKLGDVVKKANTGADAIQKAPIVDEDTGIKCLRVGDITNRRSFEEWGFCKVTNQHFSQYQLKKDDIIVTRTSALGLNVLILKDLSSVFNNGLIRIKIKDEINNIFVYYSMQNKWYKEYIARITYETSTRPNMQINYLLDFPLIYANKDLEERFSLFASVMLLKQDSNNQQIQTLTKTRDALLPKLMSGQLRVKE